MLPPHKTFFEGENRFSSFFYLNKINIKNGRLMINSHPAPIYIYKNNLYDPYKDDQKNTFLRY
jgi:hypothetical protein